MVRVRTSEGMAKKRGGRCAAPPFFTPPWVLMQTALALLKCRNILKVNGVKIKMSQVTFLIAEGLMRIALHSNELETSYLSSRDN